MEQTEELSINEKQIDQLLGKSAFYLQTYRAIDAQGKARFSYAECSRFSMKLKQLKFS